ncbi:MAG: 3,4-dihydroxy-2-butanone-4-phosphate synthase [Corynebacterium sp.]|nr:3,4-dihydroxy-2-butanone-4-phosphate synthase [Corynebacterium sp.]
MGNSSNKSTAGLSRAAKHQLVRDAIDAIAAGKAVLVTDDSDRENEADLIFAADKATPELVAFMVRYSSGYICVSLEQEALSRLRIPPMTRVNEDLRGTAYRVTVDAATGTTGISATSRAETLRRLSNPESQAADFTRPGHVVPLCAVPGGVAERPGHTEAAIDLARLAGCAPAGVLCEVVSEDDPTDMMRGRELRNFAREHDLLILPIAYLVDYLLENPLHTEESALAVRPSVVHREVQVDLPTEFGNFQAIGYTGQNGDEHMVLMNPVGEAFAEPKTGHGPRVRIHSECATGDIFGSRRCDCGPQLHSAMEDIAANGGLIIYMRGHEGRGIGLISKLKAYDLQSRGMDTLDANTALGLPVDARNYADAVAILRDLGFEEVQLITNNPEKAEYLRAHNIQVHTVHHTTHINKDNADYLRAKRDRMGHYLPEIENPEFEI